MNDEGVWKMLKSKYLLLYGYFRYQYFKRDADELESWIQEKLQTYQHEDFKDLANLQSKKQKYQALELEVTAHAKTLNALDTSGEEMISQAHYAAEIIRVLFLYFSLIFISFRKYLINCMLYGIN